MPEVRPAARVAAKRLRLGLYGLVLLRRVLEGITLDFVPAAVHRILRQLTWRAILSSAILQSASAVTPPDGRAEAGQLLAAGKLDQAETTLKSWVKTTPTDAAAWNMLGTIHAQRGDLVQAERDFLLAVKYNPRLTPAWLNLGRIYQLKAQDQENLDKGISAYQTVLKLAPGNPEAHHQLGLLLQWRGSFQDSLAHLDQLPSEDKRRRPAMALRCADLAALGKTGAALDTAQTLLDDPGLEESDILAVLPAVEAHNDEVTLYLLKALDARHLAGPRTLSKLGTAYEKSEDLAAARKVFERSCQSAPSDPGPLMDLARVAWKQKDFDGTLGYLAQARSLDPSNPAVHFLFGLAANEVKAPAEARQSIRRALELAPDNPYYNYAAGVLELQWREKDAAVPYLTKYVAARPDDPRGHLALGLAYFSLLKNEEAKRELMPLISQTGASGAAELLLGRIAVREDDAAAALAHFQRAVQLDSKSADAQAELASVYLGKSDLAAARKATESALALDAENFAANQMLLRLYQRSQDPRMKEQSERLKKLAERKETESRLVQRSIEVRPY